MVKRSGAIQRLRRMLIKPTMIPTAMALIVITVSGLHADRQNTVLFEQQERAEVFSSLSLISARLEGNINGNIQLVRGLVSTISTEPDMNQSRFEALAENLFRERSQLRNIALAPGLVVSMVYPLAGNERAIGLDYRSNPEQRDMALRARDEGELVFAGPLELVQGGKAFVARFPVFTRESGSRQFWGLASAVLDEHRLYADSGLFDPDLPIEIAITGKDASGGYGKPFLGSIDIPSDRPVSSSVQVPHGSWLITARPRGGWKGQPENAGLVRLLIVLAGVLILVPITFAGRLLEERQEHVAQLREREQELGVLSRRLGLALDTSQVGVWDYHIGRQEIVWDDRMNEIYGLPTDGGTRDFTHWYHSLHPEDRERAVEEFATACETRGRYESEYRIVTPGGATRNIRAIGAPYRDTTGGARIVGVNWDVSADVARNEALKQAQRLTQARNAELEAAKVRIEHNALHDSLTGLPNRRYLDEMMERECLRCAETGASIALLHIDLDRFKQINDTLGHAAGDAMLIHAANVLKGNVRDNDLVARIGGDEFVVVCKSLHRPRDLARLAGRLVRQMRQPVAYEGHQCRFGISVGIAKAAGAEADPKRLLINGDIALYRAKSRGRNRFEFFTAALQAEIVTTKRVADEILSGLERDEFTAYFQPQFDAKTLDLIGVEALARWNHPQEGLLTPDRFIATAEELNVVASIDRLVLDKALAQLNAWRSAGLQVPRVSVNVSLRRLHDEELIRSLNTLKFEPGSLSFELVESIYLDESDEVVAWNIDRIKELGIDIEIDDFGTGYASIVSLTKLKPARLKIDRQLIEPIVGSAAQRDLVRSIIHIGRSLGIEAVAEGVETMEHARILAELGCPALQGYALARPMSGADFAAFVGEQRWRAAS